MYTDIRTEVFQRSLDKGYIRPDEDGFVGMSIITNDRTLDFELDECNHAPVLQALQILIEFYQVTLPQYSSKLDYDAIDGSTSLLHNHRGNFS